MDTSKNIDTEPGARQSSKRQRRSRIKNKKNPGGEGGKEPNNVEELVDLGWKKEKNVTANKVFLSGMVIVEGRLHATDKLCLRGDCIVTEKLECEGNFTLSGTIWLWNKPATTKNLIILTRGVINGDMIVSTGVYIKGNCTINGKLTVTGTVRLNGTLKCKRLITTGPITKFGSRSKVIVEEKEADEDEDAIVAEQVRSLCEHTTST